MINFEKKKINFVMGNFQTNTKFILNTLFHTLPHLNPIPINLLPTSPFPRFKTSELVCDPFSLSRDIGAWKGHEWVHI